LLRAKHGRRGRSPIGTSPGPAGRHLITTAAATAAIAATPSSRLAGPACPRQLEPCRGGGGLCVSRVGGEFAIGRIDSGQRTHAKRAIGRATPRRRSR
jgi:hypothetical protein